MKLPLETLRQIKLDYQRQYNETILRLQELKGVLDQLAEVSLANEIEEGISGQTADQAPTKPKQEKETKKRKGKRGRKSVWGKFVLNRLRSVHRPLTLDELTNHAIVTMKLNLSSFDETRISLRSAVYGLQKKHNKVATLPIKGSREKLIALSAWLDEKGKLKEQYTNS